MGEGLGGGGGGGGWGGGGGGGDIVNAWIVLMKGSGVVNECKSGWHAGSALKSAWVVYGWVVFFW